MFDFIMKDSNLYKEVSSKDVECMWEMNTGILHYEHVVVWFSGD